MSNNSALQRALPFIAAFLIFLVLAIAYSPSVLDDKTIRQHDIVQSQGATQEVKAHFKKTGEQSLWNNSLFGGMPVYVYSAKSQTNIFGYLYVGLVKALPKPANYLFLFMAMYFLMFWIMGVRPWLSIVGAIAFTFATYNIAIIEAGHGYKIGALTYAALMIAGVYRAYKDNYILGGLVFLLGFGMHLYAYHFQITYYVAMLLGLFVIFQGVKAARENNLGHFSKATGILALASLLAVGTATSKIWTTIEYTNVSTRGASELEGGNGTGLDKDYALAWSYGVQETLTLLIPGFMGGASSEDVDESSAIYQHLRKKGARIKAPFPAPLYWGNLTYTGAPVYFGAIVCFLFVLGLFVVKGEFKWWVVVASVLFIMLGWGKNFPALTNFFFDYLPVYNKFRATMTTLVMAQILFPILGMLAVERLLSGDLDLAFRKRAILIAAGITGGICLLFALMGPSFFEFAGPNDRNYAAAGFSIDALVDDRVSLFRGDSIRSFVFILLAAGGLFVNAIGKLKWQFLIPILGLLITADLWQVDKRYLNSADFVSKRSLKKPFPITDADKEILRDQDPNYRVLNMTVNPFSDASTSYHHKSVGGYHAAKLRRYNDVIDKHLSQNSLPIINMLNTKYFIVPDDKGEPAVRRNPDAQGNAWFVSNVKWVDSPDEELAAIGETDLTTTAVIDNKFKDKVQEGRPSNTGKIELVDYKIDHLTYESNAGVDGIAVFSEIYYNDGKGWQAYIDGQAAEHFHTNYILRGMNVPSGKHTIEFKFRPASYYTGETISLIASILSVLALMGMGFLLYKDQKREVLQTVETS